MCDEISNGIISDVVVVAGKTDPEAKHRGITLLVLERGMEGIGARVGSRLRRAKPEVQPPFRSGARVPPTTARDRQSITIARPYGNRRPGSGLERRLGMEIALGGWMHVHTQSCTRHGGPG